MNDPKPKLTREEQLAKAVESQEQKDRMFRLVSKIISWKTKSQDSLSMQNQDKVTIDEWHQYEKHLLEISKTEYVDDVKIKLKKIYNAIQENQGFK